MTPLERMAEAYWNAFRDGFIRVGGKPEDYPVWTSGPAEVKSETLRCLRHAVDVLRDLPADAFYREGMEAFPNVKPDQLKMAFGAGLLMLFPDEPAQRHPSRTMTVQDRLMSEKVR